MTSMPEPVLRRLAPASPFLAHPLLSRDSRVEAPGEPAMQEPDPYAAGFAAGEAAGRLWGEGEIARREEAMASIELAFTRFDDESAGMLADRLHAAVLTLCEAAIMPAALDADALARRAQRAVAAVRESHEARRIVLHPDDLALVRPRLPDGLALIPDPAAERGSLRVEHEAGGVEDGPALWRRALAEAIGA